MKPLFALAALAGLAAPAVARELFVDYLAGYTIQPAVLSAPNCEGAAFADPTLDSFEKALCIFHRPARSPADTDSVVSLMEQAQIRGLPPVHQQLAGLITGLAHCDGAKRHLDAYRASNRENELERTFFCRDRRLAQADLNAISWNHALFEYAEGLAPERSLDARLTEMSACHAGVLDAGLDAECGLISNLSETEIDAFVGEAVAETIQRYFSGVESPITAMFSRKLGRAEGLLESSQASIGALRDSAAVVNGEYEALNGAYETARDTKMGPIYDAYREAILRATSILDEFDRWKGGLFITVENINLLPTIGERSVELQEELTRTEELAFRDKAESLTADIQRLVNGEAENQATTAALCRIYFCELTSRRSMAGLIRACRRPALADNPLCVSQSGQIVSGILMADFNGAQSAGIIDLCRGAGVDSAFTVVDMSPATSATCLAELP
jgi:hypothetical protein